MVDGTAPTVAFVAGLASFLAPCILPIMPAYVSFISGGVEAPFGRRMLRTSLFVAGFAAAFIALGLLIGAVGQTPLFQESETWVRRIGGALIIFFGLVMTGLVQIPWLTRDWRYHGQADLPKHQFAGAFALGIAFAVGWSPCVGPILASILLYAGTQGSLWNAGFLLALYALGLAIPFLILGALADRGADLVKRFRSVSRGIEVVGGAILIILGIFVFTGSTARLTSLLLPGGSNA
jgi:cytochrome c-type biogenesis protein